MNFNEHFQMLIFGRGPKLKNMIYVKVTFLQHSKMCLVSLDQNVYVKGFQVLVRNLYAFVGHSAKFVHHLLISKLEFYKDIRYCYEELYTIISNNVYLKLIIIITFLKLILLFIYFCTHYLGFQDLLKNGIVLRFKYCNK